MSCQLYTHSRVFFFFNDTATTEIYTLSLHDALPICYATEGLAKIDVCRGRLAQKEVWVANYYFTQGNPSAARQRLELVLKRYPRTLVIPEALYLLAEVNFYEGKNAEAADLLRGLSSEYGYTEWGRRAVQRLRAQR